MASTGDLTAAVEDLSQAIAGPNGVTAQQVLKVSATRSDGKKVFGAIGLAATAPNDFTGGQSEIILQSDRLLFVPPGSPNAAPVQMMEVGVVDGVTTLSVPAARIGDLTVGTAKIGNLAVVTEKLANNAATVTSSVVLASNAGFTQGGLVPIMAMSITTGGAPLLILCEATFFADIDTDSVSIAIFSGASQVYVREGPISQNGILSTGLFAVYLASTPSSGPVTITMSATCSGAPCTMLAGGGRTFMWALGAKK